MEDEPSGIVVLIPAMTTPRAASMLSGESSTSNTCMAVTRTCTHVGALVGFRYPVLRC